MEQIDPLNPLDGAAIPEGGWPWHVAFHFLACAVDGSDGVRVPSVHGPMVEAMADAFAHLTVVAYDPPDVARGSTDIADYEVVTARSNVDVFSLGRMGSWRDAAGRSRRNASRVADASRSWDVLLLWLQNRRLNVVTGANQSPRVAVIDGACVGDESRAQRIPVRSRVKRRLIAGGTELVGRRAIRSSGLVVVNSEMLAQRHRPLNGNVTVRRWTRRRSGSSHSTSDRLTGSEPNVLVAGRITPYKGIFEAVEVFARLKREILPGARMHVAGDGESLDDMKRAVADKGIEDSVIFHGWLGGDALFALYRNADLLLHLSYAESFPRVVLEALAHSVPVVCTPVGGLRDTLTHERELLYVPPRDTGPAVDAVKRLVEDAPLRRRILAAGYEAARESAVDEFVARVAVDIESTWPDMAQKATPASDSSLP